MCLLHKQTISCEYHSRLGYAMSIESLISTGKSPSNAWDFDEVNVYELNGSAMTLVADVSQIYCCTPACHGL